MKNICNKLNSQQIKTNKRAEQSENFQSICQNEIRSVSILEIKKKKKMAENYIIIFLQ